MGCATSAHFSPTTNGVKNVEGLSVEDVTYNSVNPATLPQLDRYLSNK